MTTFSYVPRSAEAWAARAGKKFDGEVSPTAVQKFLQPTTDPVITTPAPSGFVEKRKEYLRCATCGHMRCQHCTDFRKRKKWTGINWRGFTDDDGQIAPCQHTVPDATPYMCSSSACAVVVGEEFCGCQKFISPNARKRTPKPAAAQVVPSGVGSLIPESELLAIVKAKENMLLAAASDPETDLTALTAAQIAEIVELTETQVRQVLKKVGITSPRAVREKREFTTGTLPVTTGNDVQP